MSPAEKVQKKRQRQQPRRKLRHRALHVLSIETIDDQTYRVWGGELEHIVRLVDGVPTCDCWPFVDGKTTCCSHITKYMYHIGILPRQPQPTPPSKKTKKRQRQDKRRATKKAELLERWRNWS